MFFFSDLFSFFCSFVFLDVFCGPSYGFFFSEVSCSRFFPQSDFLHSRFFLGGRVSLYFASFFFFKGFFFLEKKNVFFKEVWFCFMSTEFCFLLSKSFFFQSGCFFFEGVDVFVLCFPIFF